MRKTVLLFAIALMMVQQGKAADFISHQPLTSKIEVWSHPQVLAKTISPNASEL